MVYLLKVVIFYCYVSHNQRVIFHVLEQIQVADDYFQPSDELGLEIRHQKLSMVPCTMDDTYPLVN